MSCEIGIELGEPQDDVITIYQEIRTHCDSKTKKKKEMIILKPKENLHRGKRNQKPTKVLHGE